MCGEKLCEFLKLLKNHFCIQFNFDEKCLNDVHISLGDQLSQGEVSFDDNESIRNVPIKSQQKDQTSTFTISDYPSLDEGKKKKKKIKFKGQS